MVSPWQIPLPLEQAVASRVPVYFYCDKWIPIKICFLEKAILLYQKSLLSGKEIFLFPPNLDPNNS